jgi:hypothetical protein
MARVLEEHPATAHHALPRIEAKPWQKYALNESIAVNPAHRRTFTIRTDFGTQREPFESDTALSPYLATERSLTGGLDRNRAQLCQKRCCIGTGITLSTNKLNFFRSV